jgi:rare lipoprotein A (peptidoglycan hydrolase)
VARSFNLNLVSLLSKKSLDAAQSNLNVTVFVFAAKNNKSVIVRTVDMCGGCAPGIAHVDLSKAAFTALFSLDVG